VKRRTLLGLVATTAVAGPLAGCIQRLDSDGADPGGATTGNRTSGTPTGGTGATESTTATTTAGRDRTTTTDATTRSTSTTAGESTTTGQPTTTGGPGDPTETTSPGAPDPPGGPIDDPPEDDPVAPGVADRTVSESGSCRGRDATAGASASLSGDVLVVTGTALSSSRCPTTVVVTDTSYEDGVYALDYRVVTTGRICAHCLARFDYEIRVEFERPPDEVLVNGRPVGTSGERVPGAGGPGGQHSDQPHASQVLHPSE